MNSTTCTTLADLQRQAIPLLSAIWRHDDYYYFVCTRNPETNSFNNHPIASIEGAVSQAFSCTRKGLDVYFSCAAYKTHQNRTCGNAACASGLWLDIDCGICKVESERGYETEASGRKALSDFCIAAKLPEPTFIYSSGGGIHAYWVFNAMLPREVWQQYARKLKPLCKRLGFLADPSRTADIASVMRFPGTLNHKYKPPRPVTQLSASPQPIEASFMLEAIDRAYEAHCSATDIETPKAGMVLSDGSTPSTKCGHLDLASIASALLELDPDCEEPIWKLRRIAALANEARRHPELAYELYTLAKSWSSGELRGRPAIAWSAPGGNGRTGEDIFDETWERFLTSAYPGKLVGIGTIYYDAKQVGWEPTAIEEFSVIEDTEGEK